jgi:hypothetical protein
MDRSKLSTQEIDIGGLLSRRDVAKRWRVSTETVKRRQRAGLLHPLYFSKRLIRYSAIEVARLERDATAGPA